MKRRHIQLADGASGPRKPRDLLTSTFTGQPQIKEETRGGVIAGNSFDGSGVSGANFADSVLDLKGVGYQVVNNVTSGASPRLMDGFQTHVITEPATSGCNNTFRNNTFNVQVPGKPVALDSRCGINPQ